MKIYDISLTITENMTVWKGDSKPVFKKLLQLKKGDMADVTYLKMCAHTGTHVDAPCHFLKEAAGAESLSLNSLVGPALVVQDLQTDYITRKVLEALNIPPNTERLLIKTSNSQLWSSESTDFIEDFVAISPDGAEYLAQMGIKLIGVDYLGVAIIKDLTPTHEALLKANVVILEGVDLSKVEPGEYTLYCLPLKIKGADGAPARTILTSP